MIDGTGNLNSIGMTLNLIQRRVRYRDCKWGGEEIHYILLQQKALYSAFGYSPDAVDLFDLLINKPVTLKEGFECRINHQMTVVEKESAIFIGVNFAENTVALWSIDSNLNGHSKRYQILIEAVALVTLPVENMSKSVSQKAHKSEADDIKMTAD